jgi:hypothetical protein
MPIASNPICAAGTKDTSTALGCSVQVRKSTPNGTRHSGVIFQVGINFGELYVKKAPEETIDIDYREALNSGTNVDSHYQNCLGIG